jgi:predicted DNA-binding protein
MGKEFKKSNVTVPLIVPVEMDKRLETLKRKSGLSKADLMRMSIERGLGVVEKMFTPPVEVAA